MKTAEEYNEEQAEQQSDFQMLAAINVNEHTEKKGQFTYLSWAWAHDYLAKLDPNFDWWLHDFPAEGMGQIEYPYLATPAGCFVRVTVRFRDKTRTHTYPILNNQNKPIPADKLTSFDVNTAQMRGFAKCCALHGLGLYIFSGEDLPESEANAQLNSEQAATILDLISATETDTRKFLAFMGATSVESIIARDFNKAMNALAAKQKQVAK